MSNVFFFDSRVNRRRKLVIETTKDAPGCIEWWMRQPVDFISETIKDLDEVIATAEHVAIERAFDFAKTELELYVRFYKLAIAWVEGAIIMGATKEISPRMISDELREKYGIN